MARLPAKCVNLYIDGGMVGHTNPAPAVYWSVGRERPDGTMDMWVTRQESYHHHTNNEAEYLSLLDALMGLRRYPEGTTAYVHSDSQLIVNQLAGRWRCEQSHLIVLLNEARRLLYDLLRNGIAVEVLWVRREENVKRLGH